MAELERETFHEDSEDVNTEEEKVVPKTETQKRPKVMRNGPRSPNIAIDTPQTPRIASLNVQKQHQRSSLPVAPASLVSQLKGSRIQQSNIASSVAATPLLTKTRDSNEQRVSPSESVFVQEIFCPPDMEELGKNPVAFYLGDNPIENRLKWFLRRVTTEEQQSDSVSAVGTQRAPNSCLEPLQMPFETQRNQTPLPLSYTWMVLCRYLKHSTPVSMSDSMLSFYRQSAIWQSSDPSMLIHEDLANLQAKLKPGDSQILLNEISRALSTKEIPDSSHLSSLTRTIVRQALLDKMGRYWGRLYRRKFNRWTGGFTLETCTPETMIDYEITLDELFQLLPLKIVKNDVLVLFDIDTKIASMKTRAKKLAFLSKLGYLPRLHHDYPNFTVAKIAAPPYSLTFVDMRKVPEFKLKTISTYLETNISFGLKNEPRAFAFFNPIELKCFGVDLDDENFWASFVPTAADWRKFTQYCSWKPYISMIPAWLRDKLTSINEKMHQKELEEVEAAKKDKKEKKSKAKAKFVVAVSGATKKRQDDFLGAFGISLDNEEGDLEGDEEADEIKSEEEAESEDSETASLASHSVEQSGLFDSSSSDDGYLDGL